MAALPDKCTGANTQDSIEIICLSTFSVFFTQTPSFLAHQKSMVTNKATVFLARENLNFFEERLNVDEELRHSGDDGAFVRLPTICAQRLVASALPPGVRSWNS